MGRFIVLVCALAACEPLYGGKSERLKTPEPTRAPVVQPEPIAYVEDCNFDFHKRAPVAHPVTNTQLDSQAGAQLAKVDKVPTPPEKIDVATSAIETYSRALASDPYDPEATLGLARAYDSVRRKGCALALLQRLGTLADHPKFAKAALPVAQSVGAHRTWFKDYRKEALAAVGNP